MKGYIDDAFLRMVEAIAQEDESRAFATLLAGCRAVVRDEEAQCGDAVGAQVVRDLVSRYRADGRRRRHVTKESAVARMNLDAVAALMREGKNGREVAEALEIPKQTAYYRMNVVKDSYPELFEA